MASGGNQEEETSYGFVVELLAFEAFVENSSHCFYSALDPVQFANLMEGSFCSRVGEVIILTIDQQLLL
jgi:hypothetical protein